MPEKIAQAATEWREAIAQAFLFGTIGVLTGLGQLMATKEELTWRIVVGRCLSTAAAAALTGAAAAIPAASVAGAPSIYDRNTLALVSLTTANVKTKFYINRGW